MFKKLLILGAILGLAACSPNYNDPNAQQAAYAAQQAQQAQMQAAYAQQAQADAQQTLQNQYASQAACVSAFSYPGDCTFVGGVWLSPFYYPWGAVIHYNHVVSYGVVVPGYGGRYVHVGYPVSVNYSYANSYIASRHTYYVSHPSAVTTYRSTTVVNNRVINNPPPINRATAPNVSRINFNSTPSRPAPQVSRVNWGSSSSSSSRSSSYSSSRSSSSSSSHSGRH
jgi:uncharacterized membrane protein YgcG